MKKKKCKKRPEKDIKILMKKKEKKNRQRQHERIKNLSKDQKQKLVEYMRNYYLVHKKLLFSCLTRSFFINLRTNEKKNK